MGDPGRVDDAASAGGEPVFSPPWGRRYRMIRRGLVVATAQIVAGAAHGHVGMDPEVAKMLVIAGSLQWSSIVGCYVFGAAWQDNELGKSLGSRYAPRRPVIPQLAGRGGVDEPN